MFKTSVASIMGDFGKKIKQLKKVQTGENKAITFRNGVMKNLKANNMTSQAEVSAAQRAINALEQFIEVK